MYSLVPGFELQALVWREPWWLLLILFPLLILLAVKLWRTDNINAYADRALQPWVVISEAKVFRRNLFSRYSVYAMAWIFFAIAAAGPRIAMEVVGEQPSKSMDMYVVVDVSLSMHAADIQPNRIQRARQEIAELLALAKNSRIGIIVFAARPHIYVPLTSDFQLLDSYLNLLTQIVLPTRGSNAVSAVDFARQQFAQSSVQKGIILITDGDIGNESNFQQQFPNTIAGLSKDQIRLSIMGVGSIEGEAIQMADGSWLTSNNQPVVSRMNEGLLQQWALAAGGVYSKAQNNSSDWFSLYSQGVAKGVVSDSRDFTVDKIIWREFYHWPLFAGVMLLYFSGIISGWMPRYFNKSILTTLIVCSFTVVVAEYAIAEDETAHRQAYQTMQKQAYKEAIEIYSGIAGYRARLGEGAGRYYLRDYSGAIKQFSLAALQADNDEQIATAVYNLGNSYFQTGDYTRAANLYEDALRYRPEHVPTLQNLELSKNLIIRLQKRWRSSVITDRSGRGPRQARAVPDLLLGDDDSVTLDQSLTLPEKNKIPPIPQQNEQQIEMLLARGMRHLRLAQTGNTNPSGEYPSKLQFSVPTNLSEIDYNQLKLWQRLFEMEEGFAAPLDEARIVPNLAPW